MELDLFYELAVPPFLGRTEREVFEDALEELALADRLGFRGAWVVEHHFMRGYSHSSKPDLFLAAASQRTSRLRLGLGIIPLAYHHPVHVASPAAAWTSASAAASRHSSTGPSARTWRRAARTSRRRSRCW